MTKRIFALLLCLSVFIGIFVGCGVGTSSESNDTTSVQQTNNDTSSVVEDESSSSEREVSSAISSSSKPVVTSKPVSSKPKPVSSAPDPSVSVSSDKTSSGAGSKPATTQNVKKVCYLTFDDGPSENTLQILNILNKYNAKATFFVVGTAKLEYINNIIAQGSKVGIHCNSHTYSSVYASDTAYFNDLAAISAKIEKQTGVKPDVIRFPGGSSNTISRKYCRGIMTRITKSVQEKGYQYFDWNVDSGDALSKKLSADQLVNRVVNQAKGINSICVLMHDTNAKKNTVAALPTIIERLKSMGYTFEVLSNDVFGFHHGVNN